MKVKKKCPKVDQELTREIDFEDKAIDELHIKSGPRIDFKFRNVKVSFLKSLRLRYSPLTQKKIFYVFYKFKKKSEKLLIDEFVMDHYGTLEVSGEILKLYKKYYDKKKGRWKHNPKEQLITQRELEQSLELSVRECIRRLVQARFPRKGKIGKLAMSSQKTFARFLMGYHERYDQLIFDEDDRGWGTIKLKKGMDWDTFWDRFPPENKDPKKSKGEVSIYDTNNIGPIIIDHLTKGVISKYLECRPRSPGTKENILDAIQCLYSFSVNRLKCFGDKTPPVNPTQNIEILKDDESKSKASYLNNVVFDEDDRGWGTIKLKKTILYCVLHVIIIK